MSSDCVSARCTDTILRNDEVYITGIIFNTRATVGSDQYIIRRRRMGYNVLQWVTMSSNVESDIINKTSEPIETHRNTSSSSELIFLIRTHHPHRNPQYFHLSVFTKKELPRRTALKYSLRTKLHALNYYERSWNYASDVLLYLSRCRSCCSRLL